jgi:UDP-N-acetylmuramoyl-tripeptide--D-alanyl-D-alanine ligase
LFATGPLSRAAAASFGAGGVWFRDREQLARAVATELHADVAVLVKGSRSAGMDGVVRALIEGVRAGGTGGEG